MDTLVLTLVEKFTPTGIHLSEFRDAAKVLRRRTHDDVIRRLADELLVQRDGVNGWKEAGRVLLRLMDECGVEMAPAEQGQVRNVYLGTLAGACGDENNAASSPLSDAEYRALIDARLAQVRSREPFDRRGDALAFLNSLSQSE